MFRGADPQCCIGVWGLRETLSEQRVTYEDYVPNGMLVVTTRSEEF